MDMSCDELDKALHDCMTTIWKAYRTGNVKEYNSCFQGLYDKYDDQVILSFISGMGMGLTPAVNIRGRNENQNQ